MGFEQLIQGNLTFKNSRFKDYKDDFNTLVEKGQKPEVLFIGCSDSRVVPDLIMDSKPGDMFIIRNVGNFVPPFEADHDFHGSSAAIEFAVSVLNVKHIIVCGHSYCGACRTLYKNIDDNDIGLVHVKKWLELGQKAKNYVLNNYLDLSAEEIYTKTEKTSIVYQLQNLLTYPEIKKRVEEKTLEVHGWYYRIQDGTILYYDTSDEKFKELEEKKTH
ncbi:carbonic anhydrase [Malaciobacter molluscorum LMG 25693]|uniref:Carbonic anhydrase n=1 Tax=Malaciobacter molluscorum LMG 25693 TaxID=870501 RepID=A0A2G1DLM6_9BACT|nr:carbonic anhydrase [Malaciobacter molluscorum]AXX92024.1 beta carbonic anhydrase, clade B [Malaciobacter molluscorum LMG 25693]PHO19256.1 carbonic anhydrase [Malaciobacter molluscorum LMG 25693]RXJ96480.1 carbonic anhydrase [Malaciobacter molluscorum]